MPLHHLPFGISRLLVLQPPIIYECPIIHDRGRQKAAISRWFRRLLAVRQQEQQHMFWESPQDSPFWNRVDSCCHRLRGSSLPLPSPAPRPFSCPEQFQNTWLTTAGESELTLSPSAHCWNKHAPQRRASPEKTRRGHSAFPPREESCVGWGNFRQLESWGAQFLEGRLKQYRGRWSSHAPCHLLLWKSSDCFYLWKDCCKERSRDE